eukprot:4168097-Alexandrium_andersonii.AAC.1
MRTAGRSKGPPTRPRAPQAATPPYSQSFGQNGYGHARINASAHMCASVRLRVPMRTQVCQG